MIQGGFEGLSRKRELMVAPLRIRRPQMEAAVGVETVGAEAIGVGAGQNPLDSYLDRLVKMVPGEAVGLYLVGSGIIPGDQAIALLTWSIFCFLAVIVIKTYGTADSAHNLPPDWVHVAISSVAFVIWVYTIGGPFTMFHLAVPYIGSLLVLAWTFLVPIFYKGPA
jgi:hypothetical protein